MRSSLSMQIELRDALTEEQHVDDSVVLFAGSQCNALSTKRLGDLVLAPSIAQLALLLDDACWHVLRVFRLGQALRKGTRADAVATGRWLHLERLVRSAAVIDLPPWIEHRLGVQQILEGVTTDELGFERAMKALVLAQSRAWLTPMSRLISHTVSGVWG